MIWTNLDVLLFMINVVCGYVKSERLNGKFQVASLGQKRRIVIDYKLRFDHLCFEVLLSYIVALDTVLVLVLELTHVVITTVWCLWLGQWRLTWFDWWIHSYPTTTGGIPRQRGRLFYLTPILFINARFHYTYSFSLLQCTVHQHLLYFTALTLLYLFSLWLL